MTELAAAVDPATFTSLDDYRVALVRAEADPTGGPLAVRRTPGGTRGEPPGVAFYFPFLAGVPHVAEITLPPGSTDPLHIEFHGHLGRFQDAKLDVDPGTGEVVARTEITAARLRRDGSSAVVEVRFTPQRSLASWLYVTAGGDAPSDQVALTAVTIGQDRSGAGTRSVLDAAAVTLPDGSTVAVQTYLVLRNYVHVEFEHHHPERTLASVRLDSPTPVDYAVLYSHHLPPVAAGEDPAPAVRGAALRTRRPTAHQASPALLHALGPDFAFRGHTLLAVFDDLFDLDGMTVQQGQDALGLVLWLVLDDGTAVPLRLGAAPEVPADVPERWGWDTFWELVRTRQPGRALEIGGRGANAQRARAALASVDPRWEYTSLDVNPGPNVDVVGDAHRLSEIFPAGHFDVIWADQVFEHLIAPWKAVVEASRVLRPGGLLCLSVPSAIPLHAEPWDFYRYSDHAWPGLVNEGTGLRIVDTAVQAPVVMLPRVLALGLERSQYGPAFLGTTVVAEKIGPCLADWDAYRFTDPRGHYPPEGISV